MPTGVRRASAVLMAMTLCGLSLVVSGSDFAAADPCKRGKWVSNCAAVAKKPPKPRTQSTSGDGGTQHYYQAPRTGSTSKKRGPSLEATLRMKQKAYQRAAERYASASKKYRGCIEEISRSATSQRYCGPTPSAPGKLPKVAVAHLLGTPAPAGSGPVVTITPAQAGAIAVARLQLHASTPGVGPDPKKNEWDMAAIGYPLWLWADGPTHIGPVGEDVAGLSVSLNAKVSKTVFRMGDGKTVTCEGGGTPYKSWVQPGAQSPSCGYVYEKPSLPSKKYTVTAITYWDVTWTVNGFSGVQTVPMIGTRELPVGELQAVIVR